jgi:hypothetical protein
MKTAALPKTLLFSALTAAIAFAVPASAQELRFNFDPEHFRFDRDDRRGNEGKRASCAYYAQIAVVQADTNRRYNCGFTGPAWNDNARDHFRWCRFVPREVTRHAARERGERLQDCFNRLGDFDEERAERYEERGERR